MNKVEKGETERSNGNTTQALLEKNSKDDKEFEYFEDILVYIGEWGRTQILLNMVGLLTIFPVVWENLAMVFLAGVPRHHCLVEEGLENMSLPLELNKGELVYSQCHMYDINLTDPARNNRTGTIPCQRWHYDESDFENTIVSEWNLVCGKAWLRAFSTMIFFFGFFVGCLVVSHLSDRFGRRPTILGVTLLMALSSSAVYFSPNYTVFTLLRCIVGFTVGGQINSTIVLRQEWCTARMRVPLQVIYTFAFILGLLVFGVIAYFVRDWKSLSLIIGIPKIPAVIIYYIWCYPSPRWLMANGRYDEALEELHRAANRNGKPLPKDFDIRAISVPKAYKASLIDLIRTPNMRKTTLIVWYTWFTVGFLYYVLSYSVGYLSGNIYVNYIVLNSVMLLRVPILSSLHFVNRRVALVLFAFLTGLALLAVMATDAGSSVRLVLASTGTLCSGSVFGLIYLYSVEVYPTSIRTIGLGIGSMWARVGTMLSPYVVLLSEISTVLPYVICGGLAILLALLFTVVPETRNKPLCDTIEEAEKVNKLFFRLREPKEKKKEVNNAILRDVLEDV